MDLTLPVRAQARRIRRPGPEDQAAGQSSRTGPLSKAGSKALRWAAVEAAQQAWRENNPWHALYRE